METLKSESLPGIDLIILAENRLVREALARYLKRDNEIHVIATGSLAADSLKLVSDLKPHVLILDPTGLVSLCAQMVVEAIRAVPNLKVVLIGMEADAVTFLRLVRAGIVGYLLRDASAGEVAKAVRSVYEGEAICPPQLCLVLFEWLTHQEIPASNLNGKLQVGLTRREIQILRIVSCGCTNKEIATQLNLSEQTVKNHVHRVLQKTGAPNRLKALEVFHMWGNRGILQTVEATEQIPET
jgi:DNA-binding NarL/FixJ family response regulator